MGRSRAPTECSGETRPSKGHGKFKVSSSVLLVLLRIHGQITSGRQVTEQADRLIIQYRGVSRCIFLADPLAAYEPNR